MEYELFARGSVFALIEALDASARHAILAFFDSLQADPFQASDYQDEVRYGGPNEAKIIGEFAVVYYVDHAVKEVRILDILPADDDV